MGVSHFPWEPNGAAGKVSGKHDLTVRKNVRKGVRKRTHLTLVFRGDNGPRKRSLNWGGVGGRGGAPETPAAVWHRLDGPSVQNTFKNLLKHMR